MKPIVVCLCGSTRFKNEFLEAAKNEAKQGHIVLSVGWFSHYDGDEISEEMKDMLDALHKRKIDMSDEIMVINVGGYIGSSTRSEIEHAQRTGKPVRWLEPVGARTVIYITDMKELPADCRSCSIPHCSYDLHTVGTGKPKDCPLLVVDDQLATSRGLSRSLTFDVHKNRDGILRTVELFRESSLRSFGQEDDKNGKA